MEAFAALVGDRSNISDGSSDNGSAGEVACGNVRSGHVRSEGAEPEADGRGLGRGGGACSRARGQSQRAESGEDGGDSRDCGGCEGCSKETALEGHQAYASGGGASGKSQDEGAGAG